MDNRNKTEVLCVDISGIADLSRKAESDGGQPDAWINESVCRLSAARQKKIRTLRDENARIQSLAAGLLLDYGLRKRGYREKETRIAAGAYGKPYFPDIPGLFFNLSHSGSRILAVFSDRPAGCDIQIVKSGSSRIADRFFKDEEAAYVRRSGETRRDEVFTELWALKESYLKATGEGMRRDLAGFCVLEGKRPSGTCFRSYDIGNYKAAVCVMVREEEEKQEMFLPDICFCPFQNLLNVV